MSDKSEETKESIRYGLEQLITAEWDLSGLIGVSGMIFYYLNSQTKHYINLLRKGVTQDTMHLVLASLYVNSFLQSSS